MGKPFKTLLGFSALCLVAGVSGGLAYNCGYDDGAKSGRLSAFHDMQMDGHWFYLSCLSDDCETEWAVQEFVTQLTDEYLERERRQ